MQQTKKFKMADAISPYLAVSCGLILSPLLLPLLLLQLLLPPLPLILPPPQLLLSPPLPLQQLLLPLLPPLWLLLLLTSTDNIDNDTHRLVHYILTTLWVHRNNTGTYLLDVFKRSTCNTMFIINLEIPDMYIGTRTGFSFCRYIPQH